MEKKKRIETRIERKKRLEDIKRVIDISEEVSRLGRLKYTFTSEMVSSTPDFFVALCCCRGILNYTSHFITQERVNRLNKYIYAIEDLLPKVNKTYMFNKKKCWTNPIERIKIRRLLENLYRELNRVIFDFGYGFKKGSLNKESEERFNK